MPGMFTSPVTMRSRRVMYSVRMSSMHSWLLVSAATGAFCTIEVGVDVDWLCSFWVRGGGGGRQFLSAEGDGRGGERVAEAQSRRGIGLRERADDDDVLFGFEALA